MTFAASPNSRKRLRTHLRDAEQMPTVAEHAVVRPVCRNRTDRRNGDVINNKHHNRKDRQSQNTVRYDLIDLIGNGKTAVVLFLVALLDDGSNVNIALVRDDAFCVCHQALFQPLQCPLQCACDCPA